MQIDMQFEGERVLSRRLRVYAGNIQDFTEPMQEIGEEVKAGVKTNFVREGSEREGNREPLKPATIKQKRRQGYPTKPLVRTGAMKNNFRYEAGPERVEISNPTKYFKYHQRGTPKIPRRLMLELKQQQRQEIIRKIQRFLWEKGALLRR